MRSFRRRFWAAAGAAAVALAYVRVASLPPTAGRETTYTWDTMVGEVRADLQATVNGIRRERDERKAILIQMRYDMRVLDATLSVSNPSHPGQ